MAFTFKISKRLAVIFATTIAGSFAGCTDVPSDATHFMPSPLAAVGDTLFADGFESGALAWDDNFRPQAKTVVAAAARTGTYGLRVTFSPTANGGVLSKFVTPGDRVFVRAAVRFPSTWTGAAGLLTLRAAPAANPWAGFGTAGVCPTGGTHANTGVTTTTPNLDLRFSTYYVGMPSCQANPGLSGPNPATYAPPLSVPKGAWHLVEIEAQLNTVGVADGWQRVWLDGVLTGEWTGLRFRTASDVQWNAVSLEMPGFSVTQSQSLDIDDIVVQRQRAVAPVPVGSVQVAPSSVTINVGATAALTATVRDAAGAALPGRVVTWSSSQTGVATVSSAGVVTGVAAGTATITATSEGLSGTATVTVQAAQPAPQTLLAETFDDQSFASRGWYDFASTPVVTTADKHSGTGSLLIHLAAGAQTAPMKRMRRLFAPTDRLYVSYWVKYSTNYVGSGKIYHPHEFNILSNQDQEWDGLTFNYLNAYIEQGYQNGGIPRVLAQDSRMIDASRIGVDLTNITEQRSLGGCNGNSDGTGLTDCYQPSPTQWYNNKMWQAAGVAFTPTPGPDYKGNWNHVEVEFRLNSIIGGIGQKDGVVRYWLNGNLKLERTNVMLRTGANPTLKFRQFILSPYMGDGSPVTQQMWIDDLTLATSRPGTPVPDPEPAPVASVAVSPATVSLNVGATTQLSAVLRDAAGAILSGRPVTWTTSAATVATVVNGVVTAISAGQATITATSDGRSGSAAVTVTTPPPQPVPVATVTVTPSSAALQVGGTTQLSAVLRNAAGAVLTGRPVTWTTSAPAVAAVVNGLVTGIGAGQATVTATSEGRSGSATITVSNPPPLPGDRWPNEPAGLPIISDHGWDCTRCSGWDWNGSNAAVVADATAPKSPSSVARITFSPSNSPDSGPGTGWYVLRGAKELYVAYWIKLSPNWEALNQGAKLHMNWTGGVEDPITYGLLRNGRAPHSIGSVVLWQPYGYDWAGADNDGSFVNNVATTPIHLNTWYLLEFYYKWSSGGPNGIMRWWVNGTLQGNYTNLQYPNTGGFIEYQWAFTRQLSPQQTEYVYIDHARLSGR